MDCAHDGGVIAECANGASYHTLTGAVASMRKVVTRILGQRNLLRVFIWLM